MFELGRIKYLCDVEKYMYAISKIFQRHNIGIEYYLYADISQIW